MSESVTAPDKTPDISVIIPVYGQRSALARCLSSALAQTGMDHEVIIVDDGSPQDPLAGLDALLADPRVRIVRMAENRGASAARNRGVAEARGQYVAFLDSDDEWRPGKLSAQWQLARRIGEPEFFFCTGRSLRLMPGGRQENRPDRALRPGERAGDYIYIHGAMAQTSSFFVSRALAISCPFAEDLSQFEDHLFFIRALESGAAYGFVEEALSIYHDEGAEGRLSAAKSLGACDRYEAAVAPFLSARAMHAFRARYRARLILDDAAAQAVAITARAAAAGALRPRYLAGFIRLLAATAVRRLRLAR